MSRHFRAWKADHGLLQVVNRSFYKALSVLEVGEQGVPKRVASEQARVADNDDAIAGAGEGDVETTRVSQEADSLHTDNYYDN